MKQKSNKQKTNISVMRRAFSVVVSLVVVFSIININSFATNAEEQQNLPFNVAVAVAHNSYHNQDYYYKIIEGNNPVRLYFSNYGTYYTQWVISKSDWRMQWSMGPQNGINTPTITIVNDKEYYVWQETIDNEYQVSYDNEYTTIANSLDDAASLYDLYVGYSSNAHYVTVNIPAGNVAYIDIEHINNWDGFTASCIMPENSSMIGPPWWNGTSKYGFANSLPTNGTTVSGLSFIEWEKGNNGGVFGITSSATFNPTGPFQSAKYLVVYNPLYYGGTANGPYEWLDNPTINISVVANSVAVYPLLSSVGPGESSGSSQVNTVVDGDVIEGEYDPDTGEIIWTSNGEESTGPQTGGSNQPGAKNTINDWLQNIATQISNFFSGAIGAVTTLTSAISNFVGTLKALYMWLPSPVLSILTSAITLAITIGVVKVFI